MVEPFGVPLTQNFERMGTFPEMFSPSFLIFEERKDEGKIKDEKIRSPFVTLESLQIRLLQTT